MMIDRLKRFGKILIMIKVYIQRSTGYLAIVNSCMILYLFLSNLQSKGTVSLNLNPSLLFVVALGITAALFASLGFVEDKLGWYTEEKKFGNQRDPNLSAIFKIQKDIEDIKEKLNKKEN